MVQMPAPCRFLLHALLLACICPVATAQLRIVDVEADIRDLDVGDLDDVGADLPSNVRDQILQMKQQHEMFTSAASAGGSAKHVDPSDLVQTIGGGQTIMSFAVLKMDYAEKQDRNARGSHDLANQWQALLETGGTEAKFYAVDPDRILIVTKSNLALQTVKDFVLGYTELVDFFESNQQKFYPAGRTRELVSDDYRRRRGDALGWSQRYMPETERQPRVTKPADASVEGESKAADTSTGRSSGQETRNTRNRINSKDKSFTSTGAQKSSKTKKRKSTKTEL
ncbi:unnamed protein product [Amoebophrya sp. A25]|nr:unnamed protein product [Amoebophrya sp. A25]|eukprot:GSA25T00001759001.1